MFLEMSLWFLAAASLVFLAGLLASRRRLRTVARPMLLSMGLMLLLTAVFDNLMIAAGLFDYGSHALSGVRVGLAPIEDFFYAACAVLLVPGLWWLTEPLERRRAASQRSAKPTGRTPQS
ncbi:lycopene cyclase domain-containing protein [Glutamicibacter ectropisis]|uniref:Lycopene cyclase domain-containing protein n=1 Tax=Glutamicibacter ectropisis TaxID=3046593 RepID=A0AAU6WHP2_9MICC